MISHDAATDRAISPWDQAVPLASPPAEQGDTRARHIGEAMFACVLPYHECDRLCFR